MLDGPEFRRSLAAPNCSLYRHIAQLVALAGAPEEQPATAHVSAANEVAREHEPRPERVEQRVHVLPGGDAAEQYRVALGREGGGQVRGVAPEWSDVAFVAGGDVDLAELLEIISSEPSLRGNEPTVRGDDQDG